MIIITTTTTCNSNKKTHLFLPYSFETLGTVTYFKYKSSPGASMDSTKENTSGCRRIMCNVQFIPNVATPQYNRAAKHIITHCPFKQATDSVV